MTIKIGTTDNVRSLPQARRQLLTLLPLRAEKLHLLGLLHGKGLNTLEAVAEAETAFARLRAASLLAPADFSQLLNDVNKTPGDRWGQYYSYSNNGTIYATDYDGPFGSFSFSENGSGYDDHDVEGKRDLDRVKRQEAAADAQVNDRRKVLIRSIKAYINLLTASLSSTEKEVLLSFLRNQNGSEPKDVRAAAKRSLEARRLISETEIFQIEFDGAPNWEKSDLIRSWPAHLPFRPDCYGELVFPLTLCGYRSDSFAGARYEGEVHKSLARVSLFTQQETGCFKDARDYWYEEDRLIEDDLVRLSHQFTSDWVAIQELLTFVRAQRALKLIEGKREPNYHDLAFLYYALRLGTANLGAQVNGRTVVAALRQLKARQVAAPTILILGFSSIYSIENVGAILSLLGFKNASIVALDLSASPLEKARAHFGRRNFGFPIEYVKGNALALPFGDESFDLVATHLFMTHIADHQKDKVVAEAGRVLKSGGEFTDEEILVPPGTDRSSYKWFYATLAERFPGTDSQRARVKKLMVEFGSYSVFYPYDCLEALTAGINGNGFECCFGSPNQKRLYDNVFVDSYQISARKV